MWIAPACGRETFFGARNQNGFPRMQPPARIYKFLVLFFIFEDRIIESDRSQAGEPALGACIVPALPGLAPVVVMPYGFCVSDEHAFRDPRPQQ